MFKTLAEHHELESSVDAILVKIVLLYQANGVAQLKKNAVFRLYY